jgi:hypothetical protein
LAGGGIEGHVADGDDPMMLFGSIEPDECRVESALAKQGQRAQGSWPATALGPRGCFELARQLARGELLDRRVECRALFF